MELLEEIQDFLPITPDLLTAGQPFEEQLPLLQQAGCALVINLATPASPDFIPDEAERIRALGLEYIAIPVEWESPRRDDLTAYFTALQEFSGRRVFAHCARNMRVSAFTYLYRVLILRLDESACRANLLQVWQPNETWACFIAEALRSK